MTIGIGPVLFETQPPTEEKCRGSARLTMTFFNILPLVEASRFVLATCKRPACETLGSRKSESNYID